MGKRNEQRRQKALVRQKAKRKKAKAVNHSSSPTFSGSSILLTSQAPIYECKIPKSLFEMGIGHIVFSRRFPSGKICVAVFLLDVFCLGVKDVFCHTVDPGEYTQIIERLAYNEPIESIDPACARKLIEGGVQYAQRLSLRPHPDYKVVEKIFGDVDAAACPLSFEYGSDGKPFYVAGPNDTPAKSRQVISVLEQQCGPDGFHYMVGVEL
jgi:hypothetical protein